MQSWISLKAHQSRWTLCWTCGAWVWCVYHQWTSFNVLEHFSTETMQVLVHCEFVQNFSCVQMLSHCVLPQKMSQYLASWSFHVWRSFHVLLVLHCALFSIGSLHSHCKNRWHLFSMLEFHSPVVTFFWHINWSPLLLSVYMIHQEGLVYHCLFRMSSS